MDIKIRNCNNIDQGTFSIEEGKLNIKYAINGTGKSTLAKAIRFKESDQLAELRPFKYSEDKDPKHDPEVIIDRDFKKIAVFDEEYVNKWTFKKDELLENSFEIFVKSADYDEHMLKINHMLENITNYFRTDPEVENLIRDLEKFINSFGKAVRSGISKSSPLLKSLGNGNKVEDIPEELESYAPYLKRNMTSVKWLQWQTQGKEYLAIKEGQCPYCVAGVTELQKQKILKVADTYDEKYLKFLTGIIEVFESLKDYFTEKTQKAVKGIIINTSGIPEDQIKYLLSLKQIAERLVKKLFDLKNLGFATLKNVDEIAEELQNKKIDLQYYDGLDSEYTKSKIKVINDSLEKVIEKAGFLKGEVEKQKRCIAKTIEKSVTDINSFLETAGYSYTVGIENNGDENYRLILKFADNENNITEVKQHLSYGERNAFALVLFMHQALSDEADFVILDDPISSFDGNKKYAILNRLFRGKESFQEKTVLMLTHDFEPVIDVIHTLSQLFQPNPVAGFLANIDGEIKEQIIRKADIQSYIEICRENMAQSDHNIHKLIYLRRLLEITGQKGAAWQVTSNIFHKRNLVDWTWSENNQTRPISDTELAAGKEEIEKFVLSSFDYETLNQEIQNDENLIAIYEACKCGYEKVQIYRLIFEGQLETGSVLKKYVDKTFHVQNDYLYQLNPRKYKIVPQYILGFCDEEIKKLIN